MNNKKHILNKVNKGLLAAFAIPTFLMLVLFMICEIYPFGDRSFLFMDMYHQYMPFFSEFMEKVRAGEGLAYSWNVGIGSNFLALYIYYLASPFHWLSFLFPKEYLLEFMSYLVIVKLGLCGLTSCLYLQKHFRTKSPVIVLISCFYAMSGFMAAYNWNIMWLDPVILLPLIMLGLEALVKDGKWILYCVTLALCIYSNYYISIMICIFLILYFVAQWMLNNWPLRAVRDFAVFSLLAGAMAAILLVPEVCAILETDFGDISFPEKWESYYSLLDVMARHCMLVSPERGLNHWPNIFCGSAVLFMIPLYAVNHAIPAKRRFAYLGLSGFMLLSFSVNILDFIWHGLNYPDSLPARQSFIYIFLVIIMCTDAFIHLKDIKKEMIIYSYLIAAALLLFWEKLAPENSYTPQVMLITLLFVTLYAVVAYCYRIWEDRDWKAYLFFVVTVLVIAENGVNTINTSLGTVSREGYLGEIQDYQDLYASVKEQKDGFFRVEKFERTTKNDGALAGYPTASVFSSTQNSSVANLYEKFGMRHSKVYYGYDGATPLTSALLNVQYIFGKTENARMYESNLSENCLYSPVGEQGNLTLYECNYLIPFGYVAGESFEISTENGNGPIQLQNQLVKTLGIKDPLFVKKESVQEEDDVKLNVKEEGYYYMVVNSSGNKKINAVGGYGTKKFSDLKVNSILYAGYLQKGESIRFTNGDDADTSPKIRLTAYKLNLDILEQAVDILSETHLENVEYDSTHISGTIALEKPGKLILSVPYEHGWKVRVNGEIVKTGLFGDCFMTISLDTGEYDIALDYVPYGKNAGIILSLVGISGFIVCLVFRRKWKVYRT